MKLVQLSVVSQLGNTVRPQEASTSRLSRWQKDWLHV